MAAAKAWYHSRKAYTCGLYLSTVSGERSSIADCIVQGESGEVEEGQGQERASSGAESGASEEARRSADAQLRPINREEDQGTLDKVFRLSIPDNSYMDSCRSAHSMKTSKLIKRRTS